jgi:glycosyltransferase involved in cell wall biosynthesis
LFWHNLLKLCLNTALTRRIRQAMRRGRSFRIDIRGGIKLRPTGTPIRPAQGDVVLQLGWNPSSQGVVDAGKALGVRYVFLVHDVIPAKLPHFVARGYPAEFTCALLHQIEASDLILANSCCTRDDLVEFARDRRLSLPPVHVVRFGSEVAGAEPSTREAPAVVPGLSDATPYVLTVSTIDPRKNHRMLYHVWKRLIREHGERAPRLVMAGRYHVNDLVHEIIHDPEVKDRVLLLHPIGDRQLDWLYRNCLFTVFPSFYEGWGLPVGESLWYGKSCIAANTSSIPEIGGDLVDYHDPYDFEGCYRLICRSAFDADFRASREERIRRAYQPTTWKECTDLICRILRDPLEEAETERTSSTIRLAKPSSEMDGRSASRAA